MKILQSMIFALMERSETELAEPIIRLLPVAIGLIYLGKQVNFVVLNFQS
jgi:26S proteasome regulatory subunit N1